jgi:glycine dehydrogenase subunit 1
MTLLGDKGLSELAALNHGRALQAADKLAAVPGVRLLNDSFFNEFTLILEKDARDAIRVLADRGIIGGVSLGRLYPDASELAAGLVVAVTETVSDDDIDALCAGLKEVLA